MKPEQIALLDPHYAHKKEIVVNPSMARLHEATTQLNDVLAMQGQPVDVHTFIFNYIQKFLTLDDYEAFLEAQVLPPHDSFTLENGRIVPSRFLVVDARNPRDNPDPTDSNPSTRIRAYFLMLDENYGEPSSILPYFVVSECEITHEGTPEETLHHTASHVFYAHNDGGWPLGIDIVPQRISESTPYEVMAVEMQSAVAKLTSDI